MTLKRKTTTAVKNDRIMGSLQRIRMLTASAEASRANWANLMGQQYRGDRDLYKALGYPEDDKLVYRWFRAKYDRMDLAGAIIDRPVNKTWNGQLEITTKDSDDSSDDPLNMAWQELDKKFRLKQKMTRLDKLCGLGYYAVMLLGFSDVKELADWEKPLGGRNLKLTYARPVSEDNAKIDEWETNTANERYGQPLFYNIQLSNVAGKSTSETIRVHHSRVLHVTDGNLDSDVYGTPRLYGIANRLVDVEKILGGDAEMFWRGARPGYTATNQPDYELGDKALEDLEEELQKYEHDLRRFITAQGVDIKALDQQVADPSAHLDVQLQAISAKTGIPKRILVGSERGELSSIQDKEEWLSLIKTRMEEFAEPYVLRPLIDKLMELGVLTKGEYNVMWDDLFSPSEKDKVEIGKLRAEALKIYADSMGASEYMPEAMMFKYLMGLESEAVEELIAALEESRTSEDSVGRQLELEDRLRQIEERQNGNGGTPTPTAPSNGVPVPVTPSNN